MNFLQEFSEVYLHYWYEIWWSVAIGFLLSGIVNEFIPARLIEKHLGERRLRSLLISTIAGATLPVCCFGSLPIAITFHKKGAALGPVLAFLVTAPATSIPSFIVSWKLLGGGFALYTFFAVIVMGILIGLLGNRWPIRPSTPPSIAASCDFRLRDNVSFKPLVHRIKEVLYYAFIILPKEIGGELLAGVALASVIVVYDPFQDFIRHYLTGALGYVVILLVGLGTYVCSTASVPLTDALLKSGMPLGQAMTYLLVGPITSYGTLLIFKKEFGWRILFSYLFFVSLFSLIFGVVFQFLTAG